MSLKNGKNFQILYTEPKFENWANKTPKEKTKFTTPICSVEKTNKKNNPLLRYPKINPKEEIIVVLNASFCTKPIAIDKYKRSNENYPINIFDKQIRITRKRKYSASIDISISFGFAYYP